ncbi:pentatricopeptide repeat domain-containing protein 3, mitochondrial isoform X2 [Rhinichthys klamathensis goyatoka]|uniref:pentatricopeptide repeat domain-containing protein 3, mitochondrial isoform X2 n=1 Tax=Rhinichthys klamathensis goyatoka TaxID=3034132 RepID=UPI0024B5B755|nr:pentatricopeptide repeat domain-containing protein 3, mitochondrial isoform X2 [Rhinichthys klamathensis goyatoka]
MVFRQALGVMASSCSRALRHHACKSSRILRIHLHNSWPNRSFALNSAADQQPAVSSLEEIVIPKKKTWNKEAVLQALASTVNRDPTGSDYRFQDDPYLAPKTAFDFKLFSLSQESGRNAAKYFINKYPNYFQKDYAYPHIPCLMPETLEAQIEEASEAALAERVHLRKVKAAVDLYDQLLQAGTPVSLDVTNELLELICFYGDRDPAQENIPEQRTEETDVQDEPQASKARGAKASDVLKFPWKENNNAERIFALLSEPNTRSYSALIRGMVKYGAYSKAFSTYTDLLNNRLTADVHIFNALIAAAPDAQEKYNEKWELMVDLLKQMAEQKVKPNLLTFNAVLKALRRCGSLGKSQAFPVISEMKALKIEPCLASYGHVLNIFYKTGATVQGQKDILQEVMYEVSGKSFAPQDPDDAQFFITAMRICLETKDMEQAYRVHRLLGVGENWRLMGNDVKRSIYYARFFSLLCLMEHVDVVMKWYRDLIPSVYYPNSNVMTDLLRALDTDNRLELIPQIWKDIKALGHANRQKLVEDLLALMARETHSAQVQDSLADCALDIRSMYSTGDRGKAQMSWTAGSLSDVISVLLAAHRTPDAWETLKLFKTHNRVPSVDLLNRFLTCVKESGDVDQAVELVKISAGFCLPDTHTLIHRIQQEFELSPEHRSILSDLETQTFSSD